MMLKKDKLKCVVVDAEAGVSRKAVLSRNVDTWYKLLDCDTFDITVRKIGNKYYNIICDDEGMLKDNPIVSAIDPTRSKVMFVGNLIIAGYDPHSEYVESLTDDDYENIVSNVVVMFDKRREQATCLLICDF